MTKGFRIDVFWDTSETRKKREAGISYPLKECTTREVVFYMIFNIAPHYDENDKNKEYCNIYTADGPYIIPATIDQVEKMLNDHLQTSHLYFS